ncbi:P-loop containing nucleoside triphosphate hydrolase protein [Lentinula lateritia]|uniref:Peroxisomal ATPase PEX6 n=1 Tax=Lentinula lateritia TaxID=40482 RepID=A0ABQ8VZ96_9AGAR|nr:P-loop containing nucleoside triphosphate hydrolase protein [Lentinula lateritia]
MSLLFNECVPVHTAFTFYDSSIDDPDTALLGSTLWDRLLTDDHELYISISSLSSPAIICLARRHDSAQDGLVIPRKWLTHHKHIFGSVQYVHVTRTVPVPLTEVYVSALSIAAYDAAITHDALLESHLYSKKQILRQGSVYSIRPDALLESPSNHRFDFRLDMLEPVSQGYAEAGRTTLFVTSLADTSEDEDEDGETDTSTLGLSSDDESVEISHDFLANSVVYPTYHYNPISPSISNPSIDLHAEGELHFKVHALSNPVSILHDDYTVYLRTADLGRLGVLSGDWVVARCPHSRLVKAVADDVLVSTSYQTHGSPVLLHNLIQETLSSISLHPSPFGSREPSIPIAHSVTVARVASPLSINKAYQNSFLEALKTHFTLGKRLIKQGDIVAVGIDTDSIARQGYDSELDLVNAKFPATPTRPNEVVFFMITNVEYKVPPNDSSNPTVDTYFGSTVGELGCWFDPDSTRMIQAGVDHSFVPDVGEYFGSVRIPPFIEGSGKATRKLHSISSVVLERRAVDYNLQLSVLLKGARGIGKYTAASQIARNLGMHILEVNCYDIIGENDIKTEGQLRARFENAVACSPCVLVLRHLEAFAQSTQAPENGKEPVIVNVVRDCIQSTHHAWKSNGYPVIICGTTSMVERVPSGLLVCLKHEVSFEAPDEFERYTILDILLQNIRIAPDVSLSHLAQQTAAFLPGDLCDLVSRAEAAAVNRAGLSFGSDQSSVFVAGLSLTNADFTQALEQARASYSESIGAPKIPSVSWDDVGGLAQVKADILDTIQLPLDHSELFADGLKKRSGVLLYGPPGTGKTLVAKAVATSFSLNFFSIKGPELLNMYIGESEANVRRVFQRARDAKPCVIFFDELDSIAPKRGNQGDSGGVMDRIVSQLLAELDGAGTMADVFVIGATNRPDLLDAALLRPGRFDRMLYLGVSETHDAQLNILEALTRKFRLHPSLNLREVVEQCPFNYTGADFYALCSDALLNAMMRKAEELENKLTSFNSNPNLHPNHPHPLTSQYYLAEIASEEDVHVEVTQNDFVFAMRELVPSVSQAEMNHYRHIQDRFSKSN